MDHIVQCMLDVDPSDLDHDQDLQYIHEPAAYIDTAIPMEQQQQPQQQQQKQAPLPAPPTDDKDSKDAKEKPFLWRMHSQSERKYQLFPKDKQQQPAAGRSLDPEQAFALAMGGNTANNTTAAGGGSNTSSSNSSSNSNNNVTAANSNNPLRLRIKEHTLTRRRKISVPELGPMTTVQEVAMDSPTIPGRPPLHERSISAPGHSWKQQQQQQQQQQHHHHLVECMLPQTMLTSFYDDIPEQSVYVPYDHLSSSPVEMPRCSSAQAVLSPSASKGSELASSSAAETPTTVAATPRISLRLPLSPKNLAPLVIPPPHSSTHGRYHQTSASLSGSLRAPPSSASLSVVSSSSSRFRSGSTPVDAAQRSARSDESPRTRTPFTPYTPLSAVSNASTLPTPVSATSAASVPVSTTSTITTTAATTSTVQPPAGATPEKDKDAETAKPAAGAGTGAANTGRVTPAPVETAEPRSAPPQSTASAAASAASSAASTAASAAASAIFKSIPSAAAILGHRRGQSESGSIMERGRPRKRSASREGSTSTAINAMVAAGISVSQAQAQPTGAAAACAAAAATPAVASPSVSATTTAAASALKRSASKASKSAERRAFEMLPRGYKATEAPGVLGANETAALATQALQQAARFEVLRKEDVDSLSRELRNLDERTEYLRRTYTSLRAGRRNLHGRICQYLRSPRVAKFSHDSMLRQEEALAELDTSIDDWVTKLEQAENRRTRVRQKLLEHVAAAATLPLTSSLAAAAVAAAGFIPSPLAAVSASPSSSSSPGVVGSSESLQMAMGIKPPSPPCAASAASAASSSQQSISTPPRSPTKTYFQPATSSILSPVAASSPSPQRPIVAQVPSTILEQPVVEEAMAAFSKSMAAEAKAQAQAHAQAHALSQVQAQVPSTPTTQTAPSKPNKAAVASPLSPASTFASPNNRRVNVESIRVYAGDDVYALLADVENQITQMGGPAAAPAGGNGTPAAVPVAVVGSTAAAQDYFSLPRNEALSQEERRRLHRAHSQELLNGGGGSQRSTPTPPASPTRPPLVVAAAAAAAPAPAPVAAATSSDPISRPESPADSVEIFLTSAVFRPERSILAI
ncbi:hypothetical protein SCUCBS95973_008841 [Sporothrix curviconia]|uniref:Up-regulated during septation protein 1 domain-containing protein n=1 Tax=Sporothrix curviconia TaxID=1260050 RepID=A0ABP0CRK5_9PEZI